MFHRMYFLVLFNPPFSDLLQVKLWETLETVVYTTFLSMAFSNTQIFHKVVWQHVEDMVGSLITILMQIYCVICQWSNFESGIRFDRVTAMCLVSSFFLNTVCMLWKCYIVVQCIMFDCRHGSSHTVTEYPAVHCKQLHYFVLHVVLFSVPPVYLDYNNNNNNHLTALCPGLLGWAGTRKVKPIWIYYYVCMYVYLIIAKLAK